MTDHRWPTIIAVPSAYDEAIPCYISARHVIALEPSHTSTIVHLEGGQCVGVARDVEAVRKLLAEARREEEGRKLP